MGWRSVVRSVTNTVQQVVKPVASVASSAAGATTTAVSQTASEAVRASQNPVAVGALPVLAPLSATTPAGRAALVQATAGAAIGAAGIYGGTAGAQAAGLAVNGLSDLIPGAWLPDAEGAPAAGPGGDGGTLDSVGPTSGGVPVGGPAPSSRRWIIAGIIAAAVALFGAAWWLAKGGARG